MIKKVIHILIISMSLAISACISPKYVKDESGHEYLKVDGLVPFDCELPFGFEQDCSFYEGARRRVQFDDIELRVSGSSDGKTVLVMADPDLIDELLPGMVAGIAGVPEMAYGLDFGTDTKRAQRTMMGAQAIQKYMTSRQIRLVKKVPIVSRGELVGMVLQLDADGYALLQQNS